MSHPNIRCRSLAKTLIALPFLALLWAASAVAEPAFSQHGVNPYAPGTVQTAPRDVKPAGAARAQASPAGASPAQVVPPAAEPKPATQAGAAPSAPNAEAQRSATPGATKPADAKAADARPADAKADVKPAEAKAADVKTQAPVATKPGEPADAQAKTTAAEPAETAPSTGVAAPKDSTVPPMPAQKEAATEPEPVKPAGKPILVNVDKTTQEMTVFVDGIEEHRWPVSTGSYGYTTPSGSYTASSMNEIWYSKQWDNAPMPHAIFFTKKGHAIHGSKEVKRLGTPASHGCVRLSPTNAKALFQLVKANGLENTQVVIGGETPGGEARIASQQRNQGYGEYQPWAGQGYYPPPPYGWGGRKRRGYAGAPPPGYYRAPPRRRWFQGPGAYPRY